MSARTAIRTGRAATREVQENPLVENLERFGYIARGLIYILIGYFALRLAFVGNGKAVDQTGALQLLAAQPFGKYLLIAMAIGLIAYSFWGFIRAFFDVLGRGHDLKGLAARFGFFTSGVSYGALAIVAWNFALGTGGGSAGKPQDMSAQFLSKPYGPLLVGALGVAWIIAAIAQWNPARTADFKQDFKPGIAGQERKWAEALGRFGYAARGVVFLLIGWFLFEAARTVNPKQAVGLDGALLKLAEQPYGIYLLGVVALGLLAFGIYSVMCARWISMLHPRRAS